MSPRDVVDAALANPYNGLLMDRLAAMDLRDCHLTAGCLFQPVWNQLSGQAPEWGIKDYDVFYWDEDLSWEAEDRVIRAVADATEDLPIRVEIRNQARVHLWYGDRFGGDYPPLTSVRAGIDRYLIACTCLGIAVSDGDLYAPNGLVDLALGVLRINPRHARPDLFQAKAENYRQRWPWLTIVA